MHQLMMKMGARPKGIGGAAPPRPRRRAPKRTFTDDFKLGLVLGLVFVIGLAMMRSMRGKGGTVSVNHRADAKVASMLREEEAGLTGAAEETKPLTQKRRDLPKGNPYLV